MIYPPEGLFYIEMDQAPGKLGLKPAIIWSAGGRGAFYQCPAFFFFFSYLLVKLTSEKIMCRCRQSVAMVRSSVLRSPSGIAQACIAQFTWQLRNTFRRTRRSGLPLFFCLGTYGKLWQGCTAALRCPTKPKRHVPKRVRQRKECIL